MALKSTIYKANLSIADIDHSYYEDHQLTLARHPSETDERMMIRLLALAINAYKLQAVCNGDGKLAFGAGLSDPDDPDCSLRDFTGQTRMWIEVGQPEDKPIMNHAAEVWWKGIETKLTRLDKLQVWRVPTEGSQELAKLAERSMQLQATVQEGSVTFSSDKGSVHIELIRWK
jgi:uncharacterized protein YaeQ